VASTRIVLKEVKAR